MLAVLLLFATGCQFFGPKQRLRIGTNHSYPFNFWDAQGHPTGFAVEVVGRAAQIAGYEVDWVRADTGPEEHFARGHSDLWPFVTNHPDRDKDLYQTSGWWRIGTILYFPKHLTITGSASLANKSIAVTSPQRRFLPDRLFPASTRLEFFPTPELAFENMCLGKSDAAMVDFRLAEEILLNRPKACPMMDFNSLLLEDVYRTFSIGARFGFEKEADRLRAAIDEMADSGEIIDIATRWRLLHRTDSAFILWLNRTREKNALLQRLFWGMILLFAVSLIFAQRLAHARKQAELSARARSQFLANMSHEIRTPMNGILGMTELALETNLTADQRDYLSMARNSARSLLEILDDILDFSRIESGKLALESIPFDLEETAKRCIQILSLAAESKHLDLKLQTSGLPKGLIGDPGRIQQVLINLLGNAVKFTETGFVRLEIQASPLPSSRHRVRFKVTDSGIGISPEQQGRIFDAFTQADSSTTRKFGGTGLGLSISAQLVGMMGGALTVNSKAGEGSTFTFTLEFNEASAVEPISPPALLAPTRSLKLLVAEDNEVNRVLIQRILENSGHRVVCVPNGKLALDQLAQSSFAGVLMDVHMPEMDGLEATRQFRLREGPLSAHLPIIALTALAIKGGAERCLAAGMDAYLSKPLNRADLFALLAQIEAGNKLSSTPPAPVL